MCQCGYCVFLRHFSLYPSLNINPQYKNNYKQDVALWEEKTQLTRISVPSWFRMEKMPHSYPSGVNVVDKERLSAQSGQNMSVLLENQ